MKKVDVRYPPRCSLSYPLSRKANIGMVWKIVGRFSSGFDYFFSNEEQAVIIRVTDRPADLRDIVHDSFTDKILLLSDLESNLSLSGSCCFTDSHLRILVAKRQTVR
jgi:hypothetical protein